MKHKRGVVSRCVFVVLLTMFLVPRPLPAQSATGGGGIQGTVSDPSGAIVPGATISATGARGKTVSAQSDAQGAYQIQGLVPGTYTVSVMAKGFSRFLQQNVAVAAGKNSRLDAALEIAVQQQQVTVESEGATLDVSPENNAGAIVLKGKDLEALSDDPDELQSELQALAGPSAGPNGGQIYIDGFTGGQLPPKSSIREIRINQNPFSAEYDKLGYGRIEIFTKPGSDQMHGRIFFNDNNAVLNTGNPFIANAPGYNTEMVEGNIGGPLGKKTSYFLSVERRAIGETVAAFNPASIPNEPACASNLSACLVSEPNPRTRLNVSPRMDFQLTPNNTLTARYQYMSNHEVNDGLGTFSTPSMAYDSTLTHHNLQITDTQVMNPKIVNEARFQFMRTAYERDPSNAAPTIVVLGAFSTGDNNIGFNRAVTDLYELQDYTSIAAGKHLFKFGGRLRVAAAGTQSNANSNGTFTYTSFQNYLAGTASQFSQTILRQPHIRDTLADAGLYFQDDWRIRPNLTLSYGLRYEIQNEIQDHHDFAPRLSVAWGLGKSATPKTILRAGFGIFYDRISQNLTLIAGQFNAVNQQAYVVNQPAFTPANIPDAASLASLNASLPTGYQLSPSLVSPYTVQTAVTVERQLTKKATLAVTYINSRGLHQIFLDNVNAPLPGTYNPVNPLSGVRPYATGNCPLPENPCGEVYQDLSEGIFKQNQLIANINMRMGAKLSLFGFYALNFAKGDTSFVSGGQEVAAGGAPDSSAFPTNQFDPTADYGRTAFDIRNRLVMGASILLPYTIRVSPFVMANSGQPYNINLGEDLNGDSIFNDRPVFSGSCVSATNPACFVAGSGVNEIPSYYGTGPALFSFNLRVSKTIGFGPEKSKADSERGMRGGPGSPPPFGGIGGPRGGRGHGGFWGADSSDRRYNLTFTVSGRNIFNNADYAPPAGILSNPSEFGKFVGLAGGPFNTQAANRRIDLQMAFSF